MLMWRNRLVGVGLSWLAGLAMAQEAAPSLASARQLLDQGQAAQALAVLAPALLRLAGHPDYDYLLGLALQGSGEVGHALFAFERVLMVDAHHVPARLQLGGILLDRGEWARADELLQPLATWPLTPEQRQLLQRLQMALAQSDGLTVAGHLAVGVGASDNVTSGPASATLLIPALGRAPTVLGSAARDPDQMASVEAGLTLRQPLDSHTWLSADGSFSQGLNRSRKDVAEGVLAVALGWHRRLGEQLAGVTLLAQDDLLGDAVYRHASGARVNWERPWTQQSRLSGYVQHLIFDFPDHVIDNAARTTVGLSHAGRSTGSARLWQYGVYAGKELAKDDFHPHFSFRLWGVHLGGSLPLNERLIMSWGLAYEAQHHLATDALYHVVRHDANHSLGLAADHQLGPRWHLVSQYTYNRNRSNTALYDTTRNTFTLQLRWDFDHATH